MLTNWRTLESYKLRATEAEEAQVVWPPEESARPLTTEATAMAQAEG